MDEKVEPERRGCVHFHYRRDEEGVQEVCETARGDVPIPGVLLASSN